MLSGDESKSISVILLTLDNVNVEGIRDCTVVTYIYTSRVYYNTTPRSQVKRLIALKFTVLKSLFSNFLCP